MDIFSQPPTSFRLNRDSPLAADLKSTISVQLPLLIGPLFDDNVLTEYITVLVCNGKTQYQAQDDLDAFLGERSEVFVSWLWDLLLKNEQQCTVDTTLKDKGDVMNCPEDHERKRNALGVKSEKAGDAATTIQMLDHQKTQNDVLPKVFTSSPKRDHLSRATSPAPDCSRNRQVSGSLYCDKGTVSVWDRLSRPSKVALDEPHVDNARKYGEVQNDICSPFISKSISRMRSGDVIHQCNRYQGRASKHYATSNFDNNSSGNRFVNDMQRKRNFVQVSRSDSRSGGRRCGDNFYDNQWRAEKRSKFAAKTPRDLLSTVEDVKLRLRQMEREISLLRSRNLETGKNRKNKTSINYGKSSCGAEKLTAEDHESRTVLVCNVHYAAKRDALFVYFAQCGRVINVVLLSDLSCFAPDSFVRSAYVTFASLESVDKAVSLSGTIFYSRALKVLKYNYKDTIAVAASTSPAVSCTGRSVQQSASYNGTRLMFRLESSPSPEASEQSAPLLANEEAAAELTASGPEHPSLSLSPKKHSDANSNMLNAESVMDKTEDGAQLSVFGDQLPTSELAGCTDIHNAEQVNMEVEVSASTDEQSYFISHLKESIGEEANMEVQLQVPTCGDEQLSLISSPLKDIAGYSNMNNTESTVEESNMEAKVTASNDEELALASALEDGSGDSNMHNIESILKNAKMDAEVKACEDEKLAWVSVVEDGSNDSNMLNSEFISEKTNMEEKIQACEDRKLAWVSVVEDSSNDSNMLNSEFISEKTNMEEEFKVCEDELPALVSVMEDISELSNIHNPEPSSAAEENGNLTSCVALPP